MRFEYGARIEDREKERGRKGEMISLKIVFMFCEGTPNIGWTKGQWVTDKRIHEEASLLRIEKTKGFQG